MKFPVISPTGKIDGCFGIIEFVIILMDDGFIGLFGSINGSKPGVLAKNPLNDVTLCAYDLPVMVQSARFKNLPDLVAVKLTLSGGYKTDGIMTVKSSFVFDISYKGFYRESNYTVVVSGWNPISKQRMAFQRFLTSGDREKDVCDFYFR